MWTPRRGRELLEAPQNQGAVAPDPPGAFPLLLFVHLCVCVSLSLCFIN